MSHKRGRDKRARDKQSLLIPWSRGVTAEMTPRNCHLQDWIRRTHKKYRRKSYSVLTSDKFNKYIRRYNSVIHQYFKWTLSPW